MALTVTCSISAACSARNVQHLLIIVTNRIVYCIMLNWLTLLSVSSPPHTVGTLWPSVCLSPLGRGRRC